MQLTMNATPTSARIRKADLAPHSALGFVIDCDARIAIDHDWGLSLERMSWPCSLRALSRSMRVSDGTDLQVREISGRVDCTGAAVELDRCGSPTLHFACNTTVDVL